MLIGCDAFESSDRTPYDPVNNENAGAAVKTAPTVKVQPTQEAFSAQSQEEKPLNNTSALAAQVLDGDEVEPLSNEVASDTTSTTSVITGETAKQKPLDVQQSTAQSQDVEPNITLTEKEPTVFVADKKKAEQIATHTPLATVPLAPTQLAESTEKKSAQNTLEISYKLIAKSEADPSAQAAHAAADAMGVPDVASKMKESAAVPLATQ